jgi:Putative zinc ribbon domain
MQQKKFCQSCTMPIDNIEDRGSEKDGSKSNLYCKYCYRDGDFTDPEMTLEQMKNIVLTQMHKLNLPDNIIQQSLDNLPHLKRWLHPVREHLW